MKNTSYEYTYYYNNYCIYLRTYTHTSARHRRRGEFRRHTYVPISFFLSFECYFHGYAAVTDKSRPGFRNNGMGWKKQSSWFLLRFGRNNRFVLLLALFFVYIRRYYILLSTRRRRKPDPSKWYTVWHFFLRPPYRNRMLSSRDTSKMEPRVFISNNFTLFSTGRFRLSYIQVNHWSYARHLNSKNARISNSTKRVVSQKHIIQNRHYKNSNASMVLRTWKRPRDDYQSRIRDVEIWRSAYCTSRRSSVGHKNGVYLSVKMTNFSTCAQM